MDTNISGLNKNTIIGTIILLVAAGVAFAVIRTQYSMEPPATIDTAAIEKNITELNALNSDMSLFDQDDIIFDELNGALNDVGEITMTTIMSDDERDLNNLSNDLINISGDEEVLRELDNAMDEAAF
jgi:hypothetical protein